MNKYVFINKYIYKYIGLFINRHIFIYTYNYIYMCVPVLTRGFGSVFMV